MNLLYNYAKYAGKGIVKEKGERDKNHKMSQNGNKSVFLGFEAIFSQFLNKNTEKII